jgi:hypothetical protein
LNFISSLPLGVLKQVKKINALSGGKKKKGILGELSF